jgi:V8-like Glu-specific endopeptidase
MEKMGKTNQIMYINAGKNTPEKHIFCLTKIKKNTIITLHHCYP